ncbi:MAG TPA: DUF2442 domain-containing protein [Gemmatimonadaceae bacterium]|nr:DUF2442 domain-containing protein [Gemmatimonadaceae bacterium]
MARAPRTPKSEILGQIAPARAREAGERKHGRRAVSASYDRDTGRVMVELTSGFVFGFPARSVAQLAKASPAVLATVEVSPGGSGLHWEALDVDLSVPGLLLSFVGRSEKVRELARVAGRVTSPAKAAAARANGVKGGRPRKAAGR